MTDNVYLNRDRSQVVPAGSVDAKWQVSRKEAHDLGLLDSADKPVQTRRSGPQEPAPKRKYTKRK